jgi:tol-pal system protein YbgF
MHIRLITASALALTLLGPPAATAGGLFDWTREPQRAEGHKPDKGWFGFLHRGSEDEAPVEMAQANDPRVTQLEEEIRKLSGTIEELNFQVLQMQEQMRKMQEDTEFRFQELEKGSTGGTGKKSEAISPARAKNVPGATTGGETTAAAAPEQSTAPAETDTTGGAAGGATGMPGVNLGTVTVDKDGNVESSTIDQPTDILPAPANPSGDNTTVAALPSTDDPDELYRNAYEFILSGDYPTAESGFRDHISRFPADPKTADAHYWLGESMLQQKKYRDAAEVFLQSNRDYPDSAKAPDMLLKLGVSLNNLNQHDVACATFKEVSKRYPRASDALKQKVKQEQALAAC